MATPVRAGEETFGSVELFRIHGAPFTAEDYARFQALCSEQATLIR